MNSTQTTQSCQFLVGGDISALTKIEEHGGIFRDAGQPGDAIQIMVAHGFNCFRLRLFVDPTYNNVVVNDLEYTVALARRTKAAGAQLLLNFHYSDTWADPGHQNKPGAWEGLDFDALVEAVHQYMRDSIAVFGREGVLPDMVQVGNEITPGMIWPDGKLHGVGEPEEQWRKFGRLLKAGVQGVRDAANGQPIRIMLHIDRGGDWKRTEWFFTHIEQHGIPYDIIGLSYYPWWHGSMVDLHENLQHTATTFGKDIFVVETAYPFQPMEFRKVNDWEARMQWPMTPEGQAAFVTELAETVRATPDGHGIGILWWYPEGILVDGLHIWNGGRTALFDENGDVLPAMDAFSR